MKKKIISIILLVITLLPVMSVQAITRVSCGNITCIPKKIPDLTSMFFTIIQIAIPVILVIIGSIDLVKGMSAQKEDEMKKGQKMFVKRLVVAAVVFFIVVFVKLLVSIIADSNTESDNITNCIDCFISGDCSQDDSCKK